MTLHSDYLRTLERASQIDKPVMSNQLLGRTSQFLKRRWIVEDGYLSVIPVDVLDGEDEVEVLVDADAGTYSYRRLGGLTAIVTRPLAEITVYAFNIDVWLNDLATLFEIEPSKIARNRVLIEGHLWHLGDLRIGRTHKFVPIYVARRPQKCTSKWSETLLDPERSSHGIVLVTESLTDVNLPNSHQGREIDAMTIEVAGVIALNGEVLDRVLRGIPEGSGDDGDRFSEITGTLKLQDMAVERTFIGIQKSVVAMFWRARHQPSLKWSEVVAQTGCGKDPGSVFGKAEWKILLERVETGCYRIRVSHSKK